MSSYISNVWRGLLVALLPLAMAGSPVTSAVADQPQFIPIDETFLDEFLTEVCGFPVELQLHGTLIVKEASDGSLIMGADNVYTYTNLATGREVVERLSGSQLTKLELAGDVDSPVGIFTLTFRGADRIIVPGMGAVFIDFAGRKEQTIVVDLETFEVISVEVTQQGRDDKMFAETLCMLLSL